MPAPDWQQVTFEKGLNVFDRASVLQDGEAQALENFEWVAGGVTPRPAWKAAGTSPTGEPSSKRGRAIYTDYYQSGIRRLVVTVFDNSANFVTYRTNVADPTAFNAYTQIDTVAVTAPFQPLPMAYAVGNNVLLMSNPGMTSNRMRYWDGTTATSVATDEIAGRTLVYHLNRFWTGGAIVSPTNLRFSEIGDTTNWNTSENFIPVAQDDGEPIEDVVIWDRGLLIGKAHSLHFLSGYTVDNFALAPINKRIGCAPGRSLIVTEHGVFILGIDGNAYLFDGAEVKPITTKVTITRPTSGYMTGAWVGGKLYLSGTVTPTVAYAFDGARWRKETYADTANAPQDLVAYDDRYLLCTSTNGSRLASVREETGAFATSGYRSPATDAGASEAFTATSKEWWTRGPTGKTTLRSVYIRYHQWVAGVAMLVVTPIVDGVPITVQAKMIGGMAAPGDYVDRVDFAAELSGRNFALKLSCAPSSGGPTYTVDECYAKVIVDAGVR